MKRSVIILLLLSFCAVSIAQERSQRDGVKEAITLEQAIEMTLSNNPQIAAVEHEQQEARYERKAAIGLRMPQIGVTGTYVHLGDDVTLNLNKTRDALGGALGTIPGLPPAVTDIFAKDWKYRALKQDIVYVGGSVVLPLWMGGKINAANRGARLTEESTQQKKMQTRAELSSELVERYYGLTLANYVVSLREEVVQAVGRHLEDAKSMEQNGMIAKSERLYMEVKMSEANRDLIASRLSVETISSALSNTLNDLDNRYQPISNMFMLKGVEPLDYFKELAIRNNPQLRQVALQRDLAQEGVRAKRAEFLPQVSLMGTAKFYKYNLSGALPNWVVGAGVRINIFDGLNKEHKLSAAKHVVRRVDQLKNQAENDILVAVEELYNQMQNYSERMPSIESSLEFAHEYLRAKRAAFREGASSSVDVIDAELNLTKVRLERLEIAMYYDIVLARLLELSGASELFIEYAKGANAIMIDFSIE